MTVRVEREGRQEVEQMRAFVLLISVRRRPTRGCLSPRSCYCELEAMACAATAYQGLCTDLDLVQSDRAICT